MQLRPGTYLQGDKYRIIDILGNGGFGITYLAEHELAGRNVCIKEFFPKEYYNRDDNSHSISLGSKGSAEIMDAYKAKFMKEAKTIARLDHPNIIHIHDVFEENNTAYYVMEYIDGESLSALVRERGALAEAEAIKYIRAVAEALGYIHDRKIMHLDIKPANVMLRKEDGRAILIDFGLSKQYDAEGNQTSSTPVGISAGYAPMEQYQQGGVKEFSPETDIYSLGATLYYLVTGEVPPQAASVVDNGLPELPAHLSSGVRNTIEQSMEIQRRRRPHSIKEFLALLEDDTPKVVATPTPKPTPSPVSAPVSAPVDDKTSVAASAPVTDDRTVVSAPVPKAQPTPQPKKEWTPKYAVDKPKKSNSEDEKSKSKRRLLLWLFIAIAVVIVGVVIGLGGSGDDAESKQKDVNDTSAYNNTSETPVTTENADSNLDALVQKTVEPTVDTKNVDTIATRIQQNNEIWYTSTDGSIVNPNSKNVFGATIISNTYEGDFGIITFDGDVTKVGTQAFYNCKKLKSVTLPNSVTEIGGLAFNSCGKLSNIYIPDSVTKIGENAFAYTIITEIVVPKGVTKLGYKSFSGCSSLKSVNIHNGVTEIGDDAFSECKSLSSITMPNSVTMIGDAAFSYCESLTSVTIPNSVTAIGEWAFGDCKSLKNVTIPNSVTTIGEYAFCRCESLTSVTIPNSVTTIGECAFRGCSSLKEFNGKFASPDGRCLIIDDILVEIAPAGITEYTIPYGVTKIESGAFAHCTSLTSITIPNSVKTIEGGAFAYCTNLTSVTIPNSVKTIEGGTFDNCYSLTSVTIPNSVTTIGGYAFNNCFRLTSITIPNSVTTIGDYAFYGWYKLSEETKNKIKSINPNAL